MLAPSDASLVFPCAQLITVSPQRLAILTLLYKRRFSGTNCVHRESHLLYLKTEAGETIFATRNAGYRDLMRLRLDTADTSGLAV